MPEIILSYKDKMTRDDVENLKQSWLLDPHFDLETTPGFEEYVDELKIFRLERELSFAKSRLQKYWEFTQALREVMSGI